MSSLRMVIASAMLITSWRVRALSAYDVSLLPNGTPPINTTTPFFVYVTSTTSFGIGVPSWSMPAAKPSSTPSASDGYESTSGQSLVSTTTITGQGQGVSVTRYLGLLRLNSNTPDPGNISREDLENWIRLRAPNETFSVLSYSQLSSQGKAQRRKRSLGQSANVYYYLGTNSTTFYESYSSTENAPGNKNISQYNVTKSYLWAENSPQCPDGSRTCQADESCVVNEGGDFVCRKNQKSEPSNNLGLIGLVAIPCIVLVAVFITFVVCLVRRRRSQKKQQDISKIHPAILKIPDYEDVLVTGTTSSKNKEAYNSVSSSNFEYDNESVVKGLY